MTQHPLTEGVTIVVTPSARWVGLAVRRGASLDQLVDELAARDACRAGGATEDDPGSADR